MPRIKLEHQIILALKAPDKTVEYYDTEESGLILRTLPTGTKSFAYRYKIGNKKRRMTIGKFPGLSLSDARKRVQKLKVQINDGRDPQAEKVEKKRERTIEPKTLKQVIDAYKERHLPTLKKSTQQDYKYRMNHLLKGMGKKKTRKRGFDPDRPIKSIKRFEVMEFLDNIAKNAPVQAQRMQALLSGIFKFAKDREWVEVNVANEITIKRKKKKYKRRWQNVEFSDEQIQALWETFEAHPEPVSSLLKLLMILGQRSGETRRMKWADLDFKNKMWTIPAEDTKNGETHYVPLPDTAINILEALDRKDKGIYVFESRVKVGEPLGSAQKTAERIREKSGVQDFNIHSMRTTVATRLAGLGTPPQVLSKILNHKRPGEGNIITAIYNKYDYEQEKRNSLNRWSHELNRIISGSKKHARIYRIGV
jgi:integrase